MGRHFFTMMNWCFCMSSSRTDIKKMDFKNHQGIWRLPETWIKPDELLCLCYILHLKNAPTLWSWQPSTSLWASRKWLNFLFWVKYPFNMDLLLCIFKPYWGENKIKQTKHKDTKWETAGRKPATDTEPVSQPVHVVTELKLSQNKIKTKTSLLSKQQTRQVTTCTSWWHPDVKHTVTLHVPLHTQLSTPPPPPHTASWVMPIPRKTFLQMIRVMPKGSVVSFSLQVMTSHDKRG